MKSYKFTNLIEVYDQVQSMIEGTRIFAMNEGVSVDILDMEARHSNETAYITFMVNGFQRYYISCLKPKYNSKWEWGIGRCDSGRPVQITKEQLYDGSFVEMLDKENSTQHNS